MIFVRFTWYSIYRNQIQGDSHYVYHTKRAEKYSAKQGQKYFDGGDCPRDHRHHSYFADHQHLFGADMWKYDYNVCLIIGIGIGVAVAQPVSDVLLQNQVAAAEASNDSSVPSMNYAGVQTDRNAKPLTDLDVNLNIIAVTTIILLSLMLVLISSAAGISNITRYEPIKILIERNSVSDFSTVLSFIFESLNIINNQK